MPEDEKWLFRPKDGQEPSIKFFLYENIIHNRKVTALVYDQAFTIRAFSAGEHIAIIPMGRTDEVIYRAYYATKRDEKNIPPLPKDVVQGYLDSGDKGFELDSIFLHSWDCRPQFDAATEIPGFSTKDYDTIYFLSNYSDDYKMHLISDLLAKSKIPSVEHEQKRKQLLAYNSK